MVGAVTARTFLTQDKRLKTCRRQEPQGCRLGVRASTRLQTTLVAATVGLNIVAVFAST